MYKGDKRRREKTKAI
jgi:hypothetical protein